MAFRHLILHGAVLAAFATAGVPALAQNKTQIHGEADLPRFVYPVSTSASALLQSDPAQFKATLLDPAQRDFDSILANDEIADKATMRELLGTQLTMLELSGQFDAALKSIDRERDLEEKPAAKLTAGLFARARIEAAIETRQTSGPQYIASFKSHYAAAINALPWDVVQDTIKQQYASTLLTSKAVIVGGIQTMLDVVTTRSKGLDNQSAWTLIGARDYVTFGLPVKDARAEVLRAYITQHNVVKPDIWEAREVVLTSDQHLTPVPVAIWDSGIDIGLFPGQVFDDLKGSPSGHHGLAFSDQGMVEKTWLHPLTTAQKAEYPLMLSDIQGRLDIENGVQSPQAKQLEDERATSTAAQIFQRNELDKVLGHYIHGTHCAGIAARNNPYARLVVARFNDDLADLEFAPTPEWANRMAGDFKSMSDFFNSRHVRVVNMSWGDEVSEFEAWLSRTGGGKDAATRKASAEQLFAIWKQAVQSTIANSPDTLFITAAGNSDSDASFLDDVPASLHLPNLIAVGAVNQAGDETSFTSSGETVLVHADGYQVDSFAPGGTRVKLSGTSMASPNVVNLAAKLFALDPTLTPAQVIRLIREGADASADGRIHLINPKRSAEFLANHNTAQLDTAAPAAR